MKRLIFSGIMVCIILASTYGFSLVAAQNDNACPPDQLQTWKDHTFSLLQRYKTVPLDPPDLRVVADLQHLRREFDTLSIPNCVVTPSPNLFANMLNLTTDSVVLALLNDPETETLSIQATNLRVQVEGFFVGFVPQQTFPQDRPGTAIISPEAGRFADLQIHVEGIVARADVGDNELWLFAAAPNGRYYPQVNNACTTPTPILLREGESEWDITAFVGTAEDSGALYDLVLGTLTPENAAKITIKFPAWCPDYFEGLPYEALYEELQFNELDRVKITRQ